MKKKQKKAKRQLRKKNKKAKQTAAREKENILRVTISWKDP